MSIVDTNADRVIETISSTLISRNQSHPRNNYFTPANRSSRHSGMVKTAGECDTILEYLQQRGAAPPLHSPLSGGLQDERRPDQ